MLSRSPERATDLPGGVRVERWDAHSAEGWGHLAEGADAIVNLAGASLAGAVLVLVGVVVGALLPTKAKAEGQEECKSRSGQVLPRCL